MRRESSSEQGLEAAHPKARVLIVDDHAAYRVAVSEWFAIHDGVATVAQADSVAMALSALQESAVDLVVMDVHMPSTNGIDGALEILRRDGTICIALCSTSGAVALPELGRLPFDSGRITFVEKSDLEPDTLMAWFENTVRS